MLDLLLSGKTGEKFKVYGNWHAAQTVLALAASILSLVLGLHHRPPKENRRKACLTF